ncbi:Uncharacterised protein [Salmonella enterica subsp. enterica serovar Bovismorbificans]|uniref:Uncharacterized protein n=1 Tax=Salmonella enterica subsp. enterica serovar Bovismorbificans TaxID=58097 RepID=A0A655CRH4_SALET|nr:Uncharacterised protein [Salmonella enterica subsp. enterica serovar Bovismorbificans]
MPTPPTVASPISRRPMPRSTIWPSPPTAIIEAMTTIERASISV